MELREYWGVVRKYLWIILLTTVVGGGAAFYFTYTTPPSYRAETTLEMDPTAGSLSDPSSAYLYSYNTRLVEQAVRGFSTKADAPQFRQEVQDRLGLEQIGGSIDIRQVADTQFVRISAESGDPALAQALANTVAQVLIDTETRRRQARIQEALSDLEAEIETLEGNIAGTREQLAILGPSDETASELARQERSRLESELSRNETRLVVLLDSAEEFRRALTQRAGYLSVYIPAELPEEAIAPPVAQRTLLGAASGLVIGLSVAFLLEYLDDTIRSPQDVKRALPVGVLGALPRLKGTDDGIPLVVVQDALRPASEAFRSLRTSVQFSGVDQPLRTLLVTSPLPMDGKSFTAANLAAVMAQGGQRVILVDSDLRRSVLHRLFGIPREPGLTSAMLSAETGSTDAAYGSADQLFSDSQRRAPILRETEVESLRVLTVGPHAHNPAELLASQRFKAFVSWLKKQADVVIFDSPPVLAVTDASLLANMVDGTLLVVNAGETRRPAAVQAVERLTDVGGKVLGVVLNRLTPSSDGYYYYYYHGRGYYSGQDRRSEQDQRGGWLARALGRVRGETRSEQDEEREVRR